MTFNSFVIRPLKFTATVTALVAMSASASLAQKAEKKADAKAPVAAPSDVEIPTKPFGNPDAPQGGVFTVNLKAEPTTLNPITSTDLYASSVQSYILDSLMERSPETYKWMPALAEKVDIAADGRSYTFTLREGAKFHDGKPVTVEDVKFSFDVIFDPKYNAAHLRPYYENIEKAEIVDPRTIRFTTKLKYFGNFSVIAGLTVLPKHVYGDAEAGKKKNKTIIGSGPYKLDSYNQGQFIMLARNKDWWGSKVDWRKGQHNFEQIRMRFIRDDNLAVERLKKAEIDYVELSPEMYTKRTEGPEWGKSVMKVKAENLSPKSYHYIGWNQKNELFKDRDVRHALYMLLNRAEMNKKFAYNMQELASGPWYRQSVYADPNVKPVEYNQDKALAMLKKAGWTDSDKNGILDKTTNGQKREFRFSLIYGNPDREKYYVFYQSDLRKVGIDMQLQRLEFNALIKNLDEKNFDAAALGWGGGSVDLDPKQIWHSTSSAAGGSNYISYSNPTVDKLIDEARQELDREKRIPLLRKIYSLIAEDHPYAFFLVDKFDLYGHTAKMKSTKPTFKYGIGVDQWWIAK